MKYTDFKINDLLYWTEEDTQVNFFLITNITNIVNEIDQLSISFLSFENKKFKEYNYLRYDKKNENNLIRVIKSNATKEDLKQYTLSEIIFQ